MSTPYIRKKLINGRVIKHWGGYTETRGLNLQGISKDGDWTDSDKAMPDLIHDWHQSCFRQESKPDSIQLRRMIPWFLESSFLLCYKTILHLLILKSTDLRNRQPLAKAYN